MKKLFGDKKEVTEIKKSEPEVPEESTNTKLTDPNYNRNKHFKKGVSLMADERMEDAARAFEDALRVDPTHVPSLLKLGYTRFHMNDLSGAMEAYNKVHEIDVTNAEAWNLKGLIYYRQKNYDKALDCVEKAIDSNSTDGMSWYNKACYHSLLNHIPEAIEALKRSIEVDVKNAKKAVKDKDFENIRTDEGYRRIIEVVVLESVRQGYHKVGQIVWTTMVGKLEVEDAARKLVEKGLLIKTEKNLGLQKVEEYEIVPELAEKIGVEKKSFFGTAKKPQPLVIQNLKEINEAVQSAKTAIEKGDVVEIISKLDVFIEPAKKGGQMIEYFFEEHRDIRLYKVRLTDKGSEYLQANKHKMIELFDNIEMMITKKLRNEAGQSY
ncbi:MAG TPA: tetratricopeptide repeat protein [Candidatus Nitrosotalea sp.]|nr:tetratricopeptide repeat protein [Candidatus Nitrosotalea sp.]